MALTKPMLSTQGTGRFPNAPPGILVLPVDHRGFPVPWFVEWIDGAPDFRVADSRKLRVAVKESRCWICGQRLGRMKSFVIGPMCSVNRVSSEPPSHPVCAVFAAEACPFLSRPLAKRPPVDDLEARFGGAPTMPGVPLLHNPGVTLVWNTLRFRFQPDGLFDIGKAERTQWFREGRAASRVEIIEAFEKGLPHLLSLAEADGRDAVDELRRRLRDALKLLPKE